jgi:hypothetical protein
MMETGWDDIAQGRAPDPREPSLTELRLRNAEARLARLIEAVENAMAVGYSHGEMLRRLRAAVEEERRFRFAGTGHHTEEAKR